MNWNGQSFRLNLQSNDTQKVVSLDIHLIHEFQIDESLWFRDRWHEINTGFKSSQHIDGKNISKGFSHRCSSYEMFFFFRCNKRRNTVILRWSDLKNPGFPCILVASKLVDFGGKKKHFGVSNKPSLKKTFWLKDWVQIWYHQRSIKKPRVKRWWPRKRRWIPRPCLGSGIFFWWVFGVSTYAFLAVRNLPKLFLN